MDYGKSGYVKAGTNMPRHKDGNAKGAPKPAVGQAEAKADLVARIKAAAEARKKS